MYKLNIPFFRDRNAPPKEEKPSQDQAQTQSQATDEKQTEDEKPVLTEDSMIDSPYKLKVFGRNAYTSPSIDLDLITYFGIDN